MKYVESQWAEYSRRFVPSPDVSAVQYRATRQAFYAGAVVVMAEVERTGELDVSEDEGVARLASIKQELHDFHSSQGFPKTTQAEGRAKRPDPQTQRRVQIDYLRCQATGYDDASCMEVLLSMFEHTAPVAIALFQLIKKDIGNRDALCLTLEGHRGMLAAIKGATGP